MLRRLQLFLIVTSLVGLAACGSSGANPVQNPDPTISANNPTSPASAVAGSPAFSLTVNGTGFVSSSQVQWNGSVRTTTFVSSAQIKAAITAADIATAGTAAVTVMSPPPGGGTSNAINFKITAAAPTVTSIAPASGPALGGTAVTITGTNFVAGATVTLGGTAATSVVVVSGTKITATTPAHAAGAVDVVVTNTDTQSGTLTNGYIYNGPPTVTSISPTSGSTLGGTAVTVTGTGFLTGATVKLGGTAATSVVVVSGTKITATTPAHAAGAVNVVVTNTDTQSGTLTNGYTYSSTAPTVSSISPTSGPATGGTAVTITGTNFVAGATVTLGGTAATSVVVVSGTNITATTPAHAAGAVDVVVTNTDTQSGTLTNGYTYNGPPTVTSIAPASGPATGGTAVTITGTNFVAGATVTLGGTAATSVVVVSGTKITATTPAHAAGAVDVVVTNNDTQSGTLTNGYTYNGPPTVTSISPTSGSTLGGTAVTVTGTGFLTGATVKLGGTAATSVVVVSGTKITATTPAHAPGAVNVVVTNTDTQSGTLTNGYIYNGPPTVTSISPTSGSTLGGTAVTVTGTGFLTGATVKLGGTAATSVVVVSGTKITATTPAHAAGAVNVVVTNTDTQSGTLTNGYTYSSTAPTVSSISPTSGPATGGTAVTITGTNFVAGATVTLGGTAATSVVVVSGTKITATTPAHAAGAVDVVVTNTDTQSGTLTNGYTYNGPPTVTSISPTSGSTLGGTAVTVTGTGFLTGATVKLGGTAATSVVVVSGTKITATTPAHAAGAVNVVVTNTDTQSGTLTNGYTYNGPPTVTSISPTSGSTSGGTSVTITGTGFLAGATVTLGGTAATSVVVVSGTKITATTPAHAAGAVNVVVTNTDTQSGTLTNGYTYSSTAPTVTSISPTSGPATGGTAVTITGTNFVAGATVTLGGTAATSVVVVSGTKITATTPAHAAGAVDVVVTNTDTQSGTLTNGYTYNGPPTVTSISPTSGPATGGTAVTITGTNFVAGATVTLGGTAATSVVVVSGTKITATTPAHAAGAVNVVVTNTDTQSGTLTNGYTYNGPPTVTSISPTSGSTLGGTAVTITGTNFVAGATVTLGGTAATSVVVVSGTKITATTPAHAAGAVDVVVTNTDTQSGTLTNGYTYSSTAPTVTSISPTSGPATGGTAVTITGTNFVAGATVTLGGTAATSVVVVSGTKITATTPAHAAGAVNVVVTNTDTQSGTLTNGYTYNGPPTVTLIAPASGPATGGTAVTITGTNFVAGATVTLGGTAATSVVVVSGTKITATTPAHAAGAVDVVVTNTDTQSGTLTNGYTYNGPPTVTSIAPASGPATGGTAVTITGTNFVAGATVTLGGTAATSVVVVSGTKITATTPAHAAGAVDVVVTNTDTQSGTLTNGYTYNGPPTVTSISPTSGSTLGGTAVTITGTNFVAGATVTLGGTAATSVVVVSGTKITATTPAHAAGAVDVVVTNTDTQSGTLTNGYTYTPPSPTVTAISPTTIGAGTPGFLLTVTGTNFSNGVSTINFNGGGLTTTFVNATTLTAVVPHTDITGVGSASITVSGATGTKTLTIASGVTPVQDLSLSISGTLVAPIRLAFGGDNALYVAEQQTAVNTAAIVRIPISGGAGTVQPWATFTVNTDNFNLGLLGMAPDPSDPPTASGGSFYVFYTVSATENRIGKIAFGASSITSLATPIVGLPVATTGLLYLNGGKLAVHKDPISGNTYIFASTGGSDGNPDWSQISAKNTTGWLNGKILRFNTNGSIPSDNPFGGTNQIYACGFRNSFGFDFHPTSGALYASDNGNESFGSTFTWYDALDRVLIGDSEGFGFPGAGCSSTLTSALWGGATDDAPSEIAPTGTIFYTGTVFPQLQNSVLITGDNLNQIYQYAVDEYGSTPGNLLAVPTSIVTFAQGTLTDLAQGPDGCVYAVSAGSSAIVRMKGTAACQ